MAELRDMQLVLEAQEIGSEWKKLCIFLGLRWTRLFQLQQTHNFDVQETIYHALVEWRDTLEIGDANQILKETRLSISLRQPLGWENGDVDDDKFLYRVAEEIGAEKFDKVAILLNFNQRRIDSIRRDNPQCVNDAIMDMLIIWRNRFRDRSDCLSVLQRAVEGSISHNTRHCKNFIKRHRKILAVVILIIFVSVFAGIAAYVALSSYSSEDSSKPYQFVFFKTLYNVYKSLFIVYKQSL